MRMAGVAGELSVVVVMPTKPTLQQPAPLSLSLPAPSTDTHSTDDLQPTPVNSGSKRKRRSTDDGSTTDEEGDISKPLYECRFCNMRFAKSQALGGHMNRHRQEREKEQYQHAQQLVSAMAQQQMPRTWPTMATELNGPSGAGAAAAQLARLSTQLTTGAPASRPDGCRPQLPPQIFFNSTRLPITTTSSPKVPDYLPSSTYYLPSNSSSNNLQHLQWNVDGINANHVTLPRSGSLQAGLNALDSMTGGTRDDFLSGVLQPLETGSFGCQAQFCNTMTVPLLNSRAGLGGAGPGSFPESSQGGSGTSGLQFGHDHQNMRMNDVLRQLVCTSSPLNSTLMQSSAMNPNLDAKPPATALGGLRTNSASSPTFLMQCNNIVQFKQPHISPPGSRSLVNSTVGQYHVASPSSMLSGYSFNSSLGAPSFGPLSGSHDLNALQDYENNMNNMNAGIQGQYAVSRPAMGQTSSGSVTSGSFGVSAGHEPHGMYGHVKMQPDESDGYNHLCPQGSQIQSTGVQPQQQQMNTTSVVHEVVDGNHCESMNVTTITESGDVSVLSAPARYQSTDFSSGSPEWRTQNNSPSAQANYASPPSQEYCSG